MPTGKYRISFKAAWCVYQYYPGKTDPLDAVLLPVFAPNTVTGINAEMSTGGSISGVIRDSAGNGVDFIFVRVVDGNGNVVSQAFSDVSGSYSAGGLPIGTFKVLFSNIVGGSYAGQWYTGKGSVASADTVRETSPANTPNIDVVLGTGSNIAVSPVKKNFGDVMVTKSGYRSFTVTNDGTEDLVLGALSLSGDNAAEYSLQKDQCSGMTLAQGRS